MNSVQHYASALNPLWDLQSQTASFEGIAPYITDNDLREQFITAAQEWNAHLLCLRNAFDQEQIPDTRDHLIHLVTHNALPVVAERLIEASLLDDQSPPPLTDFFATVQQQQQRAEQALIPMLVDKWKDIEKDDPKLTSTLQKHKNTALSAILHDTQNLGNYRYIREVLKQKMDSSIRLQLMNAVCHSLIALDAFLNLYEATPHPNHTALEKNLDVIANTSARLLKIEAYARASLPDLLASIANKEDAAVIADYNKHQKHVEAFTDAVDDLYRRTLSLREREHYGTTR